MCSTGWEQAMGMEQAADTTAKAQQFASEASIEYQKWALSKQLETQQPWVEAGQNALTKQTAMAGNLPDLSTGAYQQSDYDKWVTQQGINALSASGAAAGNYGSGNLGTALTQYGQNQAGSQYQQWYNNTLGEYLSKYNQYAGISGTGQVTAQNVSANYGNSASGISSALNANASAQGQAAMTRGNALSNAFTTSGNQGMSALGQYLQYNWNDQLANAIKNAGSGGSTPGYPTGADTWGSGQNYNYGTELS
jgi:hypothetical protein